MTKLRLILSPLVLLSVLFLAVISGTALLLLAIMVLISLSM